MLSLSFIFQCSLGGALFQSAVSGSLFWYSLTVFGQGTHQENGSDIAIVDSCYSRCFGCFSTRYLVVNVSDRV